MMVHTGPIVVMLLSFLLAPLQPALHGFSHRDALRQVKQTVALMLMPR